MIMVTGYGILAVIILVTTTSIVMKKIKLCSKKISADDDQLQDVNVIPEVIKQPFLELDNSLSYHLVSLCFQKHLLPTALRLTAPRDLPDAILKMLQNLAIKSIEDKDSLGNSLFFSGINYPFESIKRETIINFIIYDRPLSVNHVKQIIYAVCNCGLLGMDSPCYQSGLTFSDIYVLGAVTNIVTHITTLSNPEEEAKFLGRMFWEDKLPTHFEDLSVLSNRLNKHIPGELLNCIVEYGRKSPAVLEFLQKILLETAENFSLFYIVLCESFKKLSAENSDLVREALLAYRQKFIPNDQFM